MQDKHKPKKNVVSNLSIPLCILTLLWLGLSMVSCSVISPMNAGGSIGIGSGRVYAEEGDEIATHADSVTGAETYDSTVSISFSPSNGVVTLTPTSVDGVATAISTIASISVENSGGYSVYVGSSSSNLTGRSNSANIVPSITTPTTLANLPVNTWGYYASVDGTVAENTMYQAIPMAMRTGSLVYSNSNTQIRKETKNLLLSFVARINNALPADVYENEVTLSVVSSPRKVVFDNITYMQELTPSICRASEENDTRQLIDKRDGKSYWVTKLKDGNCWMSQNLDLDLSTDKPLTVANGSASEYTPVANTITNHQYGDEVNGVDLEDNSKAYHSWDEGKYVVIYPGQAETVWAGFTQEEGGIIGFTDHDLVADNGWTDKLNTQYGIVKDVNDITSWRISTDPNFTESSTYVNINGVNTNKTAGWSIACENAECNKGMYDAHYLVGNYYQWLAATAQVEVPNISAYTPAKTSICPANWQLPTSGNANNDKNDSFYNMLKHYGNLVGPASSSYTGITLPGRENATVNISNSPLFFHRAGYIEPQIQKIRVIGTAGYAWSSVASSSKSLALVYNEATVYPTINYESRLGIPIRCLVLASE